MTAFSLLPRWNRRSTLAAPSSLRMEVCPPSLRQAPDSGWQRVMFWLLAPSPQDAAPPPSQLPSVRMDFMATLADIDSDDADTLRSRIRSTHTLRELWHLRAEIYRVVGVAHRQSEAETRLALLNCHFPTRAPRSQFGAL
jgi:hypothetical protein